MLLSRSSVLCLVLVAGSLAACGPSGPTPSDGAVMWFDGGGDVGDGGMPLDQGPGDAGPPQDGGPDSGDSGPIPDAGPLPVESEPAPPAEVLADGTHLVLMGIVLTPDAVLNPGEVRIENGLITCVAATCNHDDATVIDTHSVISPGLIDAHNHLAYDFLPEWQPDPVMLYNNRYEWSDEEDYEAHIAPYADNRSRNTTFCPAALWGELRAIAHGTTTMMGQSFARACTNGGMRNADHAHRLGYNHMRTSIGSVRDINDSAADSFISSFTQAETPKTRLAVHMQEGISGANITNEFESFAGRDTRNNRHMGRSLLSGTDFFGVALLIHSMGLTTPQLMESIDTGSHIVWSPSSNLVLYGATAPIEEMLSLAIDVALGADWTVSGSAEMLSEMRFARAYGVGQGIDALTPQLVWQMATENAAGAVGLEEHIGTLVVGQHADITVFGRRGMDAHQAVLDSRPQDVRLVMMDGRAYYGDMALEMATSINGSCDVFDACGTSKFLCVAGLPGATGDWADDTLDQLHGQLQTIIDGYRDSVPPLSYDAPMPLVACGE